MPTFGSIILLTKFYYVISRSRSKKGEDIQSLETEKKLAPVGSDVATVLASAFSFNNRSSSSSFSNAFIFLILRRIISPSRSLKKAYCFLKRFIFAKFSDNNARIVRNLLLMRKRSFSILIKLNKKSQLYCI